MRLTNSEVLNAHTALSRLMEIKLPVKVSLDIALVSNLVEQQVKAFGIVRDKIFKDYSIKTEQNEETNQITFTSTEKGKEEENLGAFSEEFNKLLEANTQDMNFQKIKLPKEIDGKPMEIEPSILKALTDFVEVE